MKRHAFRALASAMLALTSFYGAAQSIPEGPEPNCFVFVDLKGTETFFFGNQVICEIAEDGSQVLRASAKTDGYEVDLSFPFASIAEIRNEYHDMASIATPIAPATHTKLEFGAGIIRVQGAKAGSQLQIFSADGTLVATHKLEAEGEGYSLNSIPAGVYVVELNGLTLKIAKK